MRDVRKPPRRYSDAAIAAFRAVRWLTSEVWPGKLAYRRWLAGGGLERVMVDVSLPGLPQALDGLRIVQVSDFHGGPFLDRSSLDPVVDLVRASEPDLLMVTGDFITHRTEDVHALGNVFARMHARLGKFAVFGNHDYRERREGEIAAVLRRQGVHVLRNESVAVTQVAAGSGRAAHVRVVGLEDIEEGRLADLDAALADVCGDDDVTVMLCHHPDVVESLPPGRFDLVLCGHTHGGQITMPFVGSLAARWLPERLSGTYPLAGGGWLHVNRGIGVLVLPFRVGARAEVTCFTLRSDPSGA